ncbi:hypothetical protein [Mesorhizobium sp. M0217]|uniref:hypothetical protein n=1 Tax=unclassified Mesorhizobium TaxID=325217 RepID=UPI00333D6032
MTKLSDPGPPIPVKRHGAEPMDRLAKKLTLRAKEQALAQANERETLRNQIAEAYKNLAEMSERLKAADLADGRLKMYRPHYGGNFSCPICWVERGTIRMFRLEEEPNQAYRCKACGFNELNDQ